jgi:hypothetical protein
LTGESLALASIDRRRRRAVAGRCRAGSRAASSGLGVAGCAMLCQELRMDFRINFKSFSKPCAPFRKYFNKQSLPHEMYFHVSWGVVVVRKIHPIEKFKRMPRVPEILVCLRLAEMGHVVRWRGVTSWLGLAAILLESGSSSVSVDAQR